MSAKGTVNEAEVSAGSVRPETSKTTFTPDFRDRSQADGAAHQRGRRLASRRAPAATGGRTRDSASSGDRKSRSLTDSWRRGPSPWNPAGRSGFPQRRRTLRIGPASPQKSTALLVGGASSPASARGRGAKLHSRPREQKCPPMSTVSTLILQQSLPGISRIGTAECGRDCGPNPPGNVSAYRFVGRRFRRSAIGAHRLKSNWAARPSRSTIRPWRVAAANWFRT